MSRTRELRKNQQGEKALNFGRESLDLEIRQAKTRSRPIDTGRVVSTVSKELTF